MKKTGAEMVKFEEKSSNSGSQPKWKETDGSNAKKKKKQNMPTLLMGKKA